MSGLLVKSTVVMRENLLRMTDESLEIPVFLGGAALTRDYVENDCARAYACGRVAYARNAFDGLRFMDAVAANSFDQILAERRTKAAGRARHGHVRAAPAAAQDKEQLSEAEIHDLRAGMIDGIEIPRPPFWGSRMLDRIPVEARTR